MTILHTNLVGKRVYMTGHMYYHRYNERGEEVGTCDAATQNKGAGVIRAAWIRESEPVFLVQSDFDGHLYGCNHRELQIIT